MFGGLGKRRAGPLRRMPTEAELAAIERADCGEYELSDKETKLLRSRIYAINKDGICKYRTIRDGTLLMVWRIK
jgi:hypothetical protein